MMIMKKQTDVLNIALVINFVEIIVTESAVKYSIILLNDCFVLNCKLHSVKSKRKGPLQNKIWAVYDLMCNKAGMISKLVL